MPFPHSISLSFLLTLALELCIKSARTNVRAREAKTTPDAIVDPFCRYWSQLPLRACFLPFHVCSSCGALFYVVRHKVCALIDIKFCPIFERTAVRLKPRETLQNAERKARTRGEERKAADCRHCKATFEPTRQDCSTTPGNLLGECIY